MPKRRTHRQAGAGTRRMRSPGRARPADPAATAAPTRPALVPGVDTSAILRARIGYLLDPAIELVCQGGVTRAEIGRELRRIARAVTLGRPVTVQPEPVEFRSMMELTRVLYDWHQDPDYVDANGEPKSIPLRGGGRTLERLIARRLPRAQVPAALRWMEGAGVVTVSPDGIATVTQRALIVKPRSGTLVMERALTMAAYYLRTVCHNQRCASNETLPDRAAWVTRLPVRHLRRFRQFARAQGDLYLTTIDDWLEKHSTDDSSEATAAVGVAVYGFRTAESGPVARRRRATRASR